MPRIHLRDLYVPLTTEWAKEFDGVDGVTVSSGSISQYEIPVDAIVSPANSFGNMGGGIDAAYVDWLGPQIEVNAKEYIRSDYYGELPVGQAIVVPTENDDVPWMIVAPTMREPMRIPPINAYLSFRAALIAVVEYNLYGVDRIDSILCPGMGTATGGIPVDLAAQLMRVAYDKIALYADC